MNVVDLTINDDNAIAQEQHSLDDEIDDEEEMEVIGSCNAQIVGIRYYDGVAHPGEYVVLVREPSNPYDRNAIRVDNMNNEKVGHIKATMAKTLAPIMDGFPIIDGSDVGMKLLGSIPGRGNAFTMPLSIEFAVYARESLTASCIELLQRKLALQLEKSYLSFIPSPQGASQTSQNNRISIETRQVDWKTQLQELDEMFEKCSKEQLSKLPKDIPLPTQYFLNSIQFYPHQAIGMQWMLYRETSEIIAPFFKKVKENGRDMWLSEITNASQEKEPRCVKGGILADDMGLGKTLQTIGLILMNPPSSYEFPLPSTEDVSGLNATPKNDSLVAKEVVASVDMVIIKKQKVEKLKYIISKVDTKSTISPSAKKKKKDLVQACFTLLEDGTLTPQEFHSCCNDVHSQSTKPSKHIVTPSTQKRPEADQPFCTLIICPVSVMSNWLQQIDSHVKPGVLRVQMYHGTDRHTIVDLIRNNEVDVVITGYNVLASELPDDKDPQSKSKGQTSSKKRKKPLSSIFDIEFHRIVLDEAHMIRNTKTRTFKACKALQSQYKFCITGTPLQNKPDDVHALFDFLRVDPLGNRTVFQRSISQPIKYGSQEGLARLRAMMGHISLRRTKASIGDTIKMAEKDFQIRVVSFPKESLSFEVYDTLFQTARIALMATMRGGEMEALKQYTSIFETLLRIRQACCCMSLVPKERLERAKEVMEEYKNRDGSKPHLTAEEGKILFEKLQGVFESNQDEKENPECAICLAEFTKDMAVILRHCSHIFCNECISHVLSMPSAKNSCPMCRVAFNKQDLIPMSVASTVATAAQSSSKEKLSKVMEEDERKSEVSPKVQAMLEAIKDMKADEKGVIFSQFTKFLDIIEGALSEKGYSFTRLDGSMNANEKMAAIKLFNLENAGPKFILCSLKAAGVGINLTRGNHIFMMDSWWNKAAEDQAMDRVHRIGQLRDVRVIKFIMKDSVEEHMLTLQESKAAMCKGTMEKLNAEEMRKTRVSELRSLFQIAGSKSEDD